MLWPVAVCLFIVRAIKIYTSVIKAHTSDAVMVTHDRSMYLMIVKADCVAQAGKGCPH